MVIETGLSDFHKMSLTAMKVFYKKQKPNIITYRRYKHFDNEAFLTDIQNHLPEEYDQNPDSTFSTFTRSIYNILELHAPLKK